MNPLVLCGLAVLILAVGLMRRHSLAQTASSYEKRPGLITPAEQAFLAALEPSLAPEQRLFTMVRLIDVIEPSAALRGSELTAARNRIISKHLDFVVCDRTTMEVLCAVELNDSSHEDHGRRARDRFVEEALATAGVKLIYVKARRNYSTNELRELLALEVMKDQQISAPSREPVAV